MNNGVYMVCDKHGKVFQFIANRDGLADEPAYQASIYRILAKAYKKIVKDGGFIRLVSFDEYQREIVNILDKRVGK